MKKKAKRVALIDGDILAFQAATVAEVPTHWGGGFWTLHVEEGPARIAVEERVLSIQEQLEADSVIVALTDGQNFRKDIYPNYKANRKGKRLPMILPILKQHLAETFDTFQRPRLEGDDILGILSTSTVIVKAKERVIASLDKDMKTIPGLFYNFGHPELGIQEISQDTADYWHLVQSLTGDTTDGYPGCPKVGPKKAIEVLKDHYELQEDEQTAVCLTSVKDAWGAVLTAYEKQGLGPDEALTQARVARILRTSDYNFKKKEPILWKV